MPEWNDPNTYLEQEVERVTLLDFVHKELILFSFNGCEQSTQSVCDGLKPSQRKVLWACLEKNVTKEQKVTQLGGLISEKASYQHGEQSLFATIVKMAQNYCGANNINLLFPSGQFGTRAQGGKDQAAPRYIFTRLSTITRALFPKDDDAVLTYTVDEDKYVEPTFYVPVVPMILINGADGIGTGWSTAIPNHNPHDVIANCRRFIRGEAFEEMVPWYRGWKGTVVKEHDGLFSMFGRWRRIAPTTVEVVELPLEVWTEKYKKHLETLIERKTVRGYTEHHKINTVHFVVEFCEELDDAEVWQQLKLTGSIAATNMHLFDRNCKIKRYATTGEILSEFCPLRMEMYGERKKAIIAGLERDVQMISEKVRFIRMIIAEELKLNNKPKAQLVKELQRHKFVPIKGKGKEGNGDDSGYETCCPCSCGC